MAENKTIDASEKAYADASEKAGVDKSAATAAHTDKPAAAAASAEKVEKPKAAKAAATPAKRAAHKSAAAKAAPRVTRAAVKAVSAKPVRKAAAKAAKTVAAPVAKTASSTPKDTRMATTTTTKTTEDFTAKIQGAVKDAQSRARTVLEKSQTQFADVNDFSKGNFEALVESGKIVSSGLQSMSKRYVEELKSAFEMAQADMKALTTVKSPSEFVELQRAQLRKYFDNAVAYNSKSAEAALKLANDAFQPISNRVSLAVEKIKLAA
jgi:phasin family protein